LVILPLPEIVKLDVAEPLIEPFAMEAGKVMFLLSTKLFPFKSILPLVC
jgi:hypothetical protein